MKTSTLLALGVLGAAALYLKGRANTAAPATASPAPASAMDSVTGMIQSWGAPAAQGSLSGCTLARGPKGLGSLG